MKIRLVLSLSSVLVLVLVSCAVILQGVSSFIIPFSEDVSKTGGFPTVTRNENQLDQSLHGAKIGSREKRWAVPVDVPDIPCDVGLQRRPDGKCTSQDKEDDYGAGSY